MTTGQIMMKLREIEADLDAMVECRHSMPFLKDARAVLCGTIEQILADDRRHAEARTLGELPFDGGERVKPRSYALSRSTGTRRLGSSWLARPAHTMRCGRATGSIWQSIAIGNSPNKRKPPRERGLPKRGEKQ